MKKIGFVVFCLMFLSCQIIWARDTPADIHQKTTTPNRGRYEIIQSELAAKWTFRLDRYTGIVHQLFETGQGDNTWRVMPVKNLPKIKNPVEPRFLIFTSGIASRHTFLMDTFTGVTWVLRETTISTGEGKEIKVNAWLPFK